MEVNLRQALNSHRFATENLFMLLWFGFTHFAGFATVHAPHGVPHSGRTGSLLHSIRVPQPEFSNDDFNPIKKATIAIIQ